MGFLPSLIRVLICIAVMYVCFIYIKYTDAEKFSPVYESGPGQNVASLEDTIKDKVEIVVSPVIQTVNIVIDSINEMPAKLYKNSMTFSKKIGDHVKKYAETMTAYNRTEDDPENLKSVAINKRHKLYIDNLRKENSPIYQLLVNEANIFYSLNFEDQDAALIGSVTKLAKYNKAVVPPLQKKLQDLAAS